MVYPVQIFLFVGLVYLLLCSALQFCATRLLDGRWRRNTPDAHSRITRFSHVQSADS
jgi:polar amino acid transport system permease protein